MSNEIAVACPCCGQHFTLEYGVDGTGEPSHWTRHGWTPPDPVEVKLLEKAPEQCPNCKEVWSVNELRSVQRQIEERLYEVVDPPYDGD